jgi:hypothetical protein
LDTTIGSVSSGSGPDRSTLPVDPAVGGDLFELLTRYRLSQWGLTRGDERRIRDGPAGREQGHVVSGVNELVGQRCDDALGAAISPRGTDS